MYSLVSIFSILLSCYILLRLFKPTGFIESILFLYCFSTAQIIIIGFLLSSINYLGEIEFWTLFSLTFAILSISIYRLTIKYQPSFANKFALPSISEKIKTVQFSNYEKIIFYPLLTTVIGLGCINLSVVCFTAPGNCDSLAYHLTRMAYYIQQGNLDAYNTHYWAQVVHPKNSTLMLLYSYLMSGHSENLTQIVQFISYWILMCSVFGITRTIGFGYKHALFTACLSGLLIDCLMESTTPQNDLVIAAFTGIAVYSLLGFKISRKKKYFITSAISVGIAFGVKESFVAIMPLIIILWLYCCIPVHKEFFLKQTIENFGTSFASFLIAAAVFTIPSGYLFNQKTFDNPFGPEDVRHIHSFQNRDIIYIVKNGSKNVLRYVFNFIGLDGMPPVDPCLYAHMRLKSFMASCLKDMNINLETREGCRGIPFSYTGDTRVNEEFGYWGVLGFGLIWIMVFLCLFRDNIPPPIRILSLLSIIFIIIQSYIAPYDAWRGRYFISCVVFAAPVSAICLNAEQKLIRGYLIIIILLGCVSAWSAVLFKSKSPILPVFEKQSIFAMNRIEQISRRTPNVKVPLSNYEKFVPNDAVVAICFCLSGYEFAIFGEGLTRTLIPINSFYKGLQPVPENADFILFKQFFVSPEQVDKNEYDDKKYNLFFSCHELVDKENDIDLGEGYYLRDLSGK